MILMMLFEVFSAANYYCVAPNVEIIQKVTNVFIRTIRGT